MEKALLDILDVGCRAMSPYNVQPWRFVRQGRKVLVFIRKYPGGLFEFEPLGLYSLGCLLQNLSEGARYFGYDMAWRLVGEKCGLDRPLAEVEFEPSPGVVQASIDALQQTSSAATCAYSRQWAPRRALPARSPAFHSADFCL
jgi:hypothetical protein